MKELLRYFLVPFEAVAKVAALFGGFAAFLLLMEWLRQ